VYFGRLRRLAEAAGVPISRPHPHMLRYTFVTTMLDAGVDLRDVQTAARHADPRTTMRYDRACKNLDRRPHRETRTPRRLTSPYRRRRAGHIEADVCARSEGS
jgi:site-specific recombinase XerD